MSYDDQNVFAKILRGDLPCAKVHEDDRTLAFMDIMPPGAGSLPGDPRRPRRGTCWIATRRIWPACIAVAKKLSAR